jgi:hypothetical protein
MLLRAIDTGRIDAFSSPRRCGSRARSTGAAPSRARRSQAMRRRPPRTYSPGRACGAGLAVRGPRRPVACAARPELPRGGGSGRLGPSAARQTMAPRGVAPAGVLDVGEAEALLLATAGVTPERAMGTHFADRCAATRLDCGACAAVVGHAGCWPRWRRPRPGACCFAPVRLPVRDGPEPVPRASPRARPACGPARARRSALRVPRPSPRARRGRPRRE